MARSHFQGLIRKRLWPVLIQPESSATITHSSTLLNAHPFGLSHLKFHSSNQQSSLITTGTDLSLSTPDSSDSIGRIVTWLAPTNLAMAQIRMAEFASFNSEQPSRLQFQHPLTGELIQCQPLVPPCFPEPWGQLAK